MCKIYNNPVQKWSNIYKIHRGDVMENNENKNSPARIKANNRYNQKHYKHITLNVKNEDYQEFMKHIGEMGCSINAFFIKSAKYCLENKIDVTKIK